MDNVDNKASPTLPPDRKPGTLADDLFVSIRDTIISGKLTPGQKLNEPQLSKQFGVSRGPLREAIRRLEGLKLVETVPNSGARVISLNFAQVIEIYEIREALEGLAARLAAATRQPDDCRELRELLATHESYVNKTSGLRYRQFEGNLDFHYKIVRLSGNRRLFQLLCHELYYVLKLYRSHSSNLPRRPEQAFREHVQIVDAIENGDGELAELLMRRHIAGARLQLIAQLGVERPLTC